jgi:hypothetical protein
MQHIVTAMEMEFNIPSFPVGNKSTPTFQFVIFILLYSETLKTTSRLHIQQSGREEILLAATKRRCPVVATPHRTPLHKVG